jgi:hypothetical protein
MRNLLRQPLTWMVIAECLVVAVLMVVVWNVAAAAGSQHAGAVSAQAVQAPTDASITPPPDLIEAATPAAPAQLPGLNLDAGFWRLRLGQLNRDQVFFEQLEWHMVHNATDAMQRYLETVVLPSITRAERGGG